MPSRVIASSVIANGVSTTAAARSIILQSVINQLKKVMTKIFKGIKKGTNRQKPDYLDISFDVYNIGT